jgi:hypothetical protein
MRQPQLDAMEASQDNPTGEGRHPQEGRPVQPERLLELLRQRPFQPFRVHLTDGRVFDVRYPDMNIVGTTWLTIGIPEPNEPDPFAQRFVDVDLPLIRQVELLPAASQPLS